MSGGWRVARAFFLRDLATDASYRTSFVLETIDVGVAAAAFYFLARVLGTRRPAGYDAFAFLLVGMAVNNGMTAAVTCFAQAVRTDQQTGTIKAVLVWPVPAPVLLLCASVYPMARAGLSVCLYLAAGAALGVSFGGANLGAAAVLFVLALLAFAAMGLVSAAFAMVLKRGDPLLWFFGAVSWLLGGVFFPVDVLPGALRAAARLLPITYALDGLRASLLAGAGLSAVRGDVLVLGGVALVGLPLAALALDAAIAHGKRAGTLGHV